MRGFLALVVLLLAALVAAALVVVPAVVRPMVVDAVREVSPFGDQPIEVEVDIDAVALLLGTIERIRVTGANLEAEGADIAGLELVLTDVATATREWGSLTGRLTGVSLPFVQRTTLIIDSIAVSGPYGDVDAVARLDAQASLSLIGNAFADAGLAIDALELMDGGITFVILNQAVVVALSADAGALVVPDVAGGQLVVVEPGPDDPWRITGVGVTQAGMEVHVSLEPDGVTGG